MGSEREPVRVGVADGVRFHREAIANALIATGRRINVVASTRDAYETIFVASALHPEVVLVDLPPAESVLVFERVPAISATRAFVTFSVGAHIRTPLPQHPSAVVAYISRDATILDVALTIGWLSSQDDRPPGVLLATSSADADSPSSDGLDLTRRELEILALMGSDLSNKEIATHLVIELATVKNHVHNILRKLKVPTRGHAVRHAHMFGLLDRYDVESPIWRALPSGSYPDVG